MRIRIEEVLAVEAQGESVTATVHVEFDGSASTDLRAVLEAIGNHFANGTTHGPSPPVVMSPAEAPEQPNGFHWTRPDLHAKAMKSVHRVVCAIADAGGKGLTVQQIVEKARISPVPAYKMLKNDHPQGAYAAQFLRTTKMGRQQVVDVTPEGRKLASLIRAEKVPA